MSFTAPKAAEKVATPAPVVTKPIVVKSPVVDAAFTAATNINHACGEISSATSEHVIRHKTVDDLVAKIRAETAGLLKAVAANGGPALEA